MSPASDLRVELARCQLRVTAPAKTLECNDAHSWSQGRIVKRAGRVDQWIDGLPLVAGRPPALQLGVVARRITAIAAAVIAYVLLEWVSFIHEYKGVPITPWNPGLGLVVALMILYGTRYAVVLFAGALIAEIAVLRSNLEWPIILGIAAIIALGYGFAASLARGYLHLDAGLNRLRDVVILLLGALVGAIFVASMICLLLLADAEIGASDILIAAGPLLIGDIIGIAVITPLILRIALHPRPLLDRVSRAIVPELFLFVVVVAAALWAIVDSAGFNGSQLFFLLFLPVVVAAARHGLDGACIALAITQLGLVVLLHLHGYDANAFTQYQLLMLVLSATGLTVGVVVTERQYAFEAVREIERRLKAQEEKAAQAVRFNIVSGTAAALAHELNQPMTAARALARSVQQILQEPSPDTPRAMRNLGTLIAQIDHAGGVIRHMRDFLRRGRPHSSTLVMRELLSDALLLARPELAAKGISTTLEAPEDLPLIHGDAVQLQETVLNLVRNAAESISSAHIADGKITVTARRLDDPIRVQVAVCDNGPGIPSAVAEHLFNPLTTSKADGLGLGLAISASIVEAHGGRIWLQDSKPGKTEFRFTLPVEAR
jgi:signal transduction histidine kinase